MSPRTHEVPDELLSSLLVNYTKPEDLIGENGLLKQLTKRLVERALDAEMTEHLGHDKHEPVANAAGNTRNGRSRKTLKDLKRIYACATVEEAEQALTEFEAKWDAQYPPISQSWRRNWSRLIPFFDYPPEIRKVIYTTNAIESVNMSLRKLTKNRGAFPSDEALMKLFYLALRNITKKWTLPIRDWKAALNRFTIQFEGRLPQR
ncbi:Xax1 transposase [Xanthomonas citri pv. fuscans]|nr:transposase [Xanthomonas citri]ATB60200.1 Xax1 transposase [Xanthomonas citri pv. fuscans]